MTLTAFLAFAALSLFAAISPGPAVLMAARTGLTEGFRTGAMLAVGIGAGGGVLGRCRHVRAEHPVRRRPCPVVGAENRRGGLSGVDGGQAVACRQNPL